MDRRVMWTISLFILLLSTVPNVFGQTSDIECWLRANSTPAALGRTGDYVLGGIFNVHSFARLVEINYTRMPDPMQCTGSMDFRAFRFARTMEFAVEEINNSSELLPGVRLGYEIHDACAFSPVVTSISYQLANGHEPSFYLQAPCSKLITVPAVVSDSGSSTSITISRVLAPFRIPQVNAYATCSCLSDKQQYPAFSRTIPSDYFQAQALAKLMKHFGWTWIGTVRTDNDYGNGGMTGFLQALQGQGICVEYSEALDRNKPRSRVKNVAKIIRSSTARVVVAFAAAAEMILLLTELAELSPPPLQWIGSEAWMTHPDLLRFNMCAGAVGFGIPRSVIPGLREFLLELSPAKASLSPLLTEFWETAFSCSLSKKSVTSKQKACNGSESVKDLQNPYTDTSQLRISNMVYKATYAVAHALHSLVCTEQPNSPAHCDKNKQLSPHQVLEEIRKVNFTRNGYHVSFDANGDPVAMYDLVNWQLAKNGQIEFVTVGYYDASALNGQVFGIHKNITWAGGQSQVPASVCSESCPPGTRKAVQRGRPVCCYDCVPCAEGEISNVTDSLNCITCPAEYWSNFIKTQCVPKPIEFLSFDETLGIILAVISVAGASLAVAIAATFYKHRNTPIVKANNSELSFLLLFSLTLCFLCSLTFIGRPSHWSCMLRHTAFGITFVLCISCVLGKTILVLMAFRATLPGSNVMKWFGPAQQRMSVVSFTFIQVLICILWLILSPPFPFKNMSHYKERIILECNLGSASAFWAVLGYIGLLSLLCFVLAFLARKLPDNFNEAKFITFSMLIFCAVWITFIPAYVSSPGKFTVAVEIFAIISSSLGLIMCIFAPKCFIILIRPEKNTKKNMMGKVPSKAL